uniref:3'-5' exonuclease domain-containing protein n=1 Tax=Ditylum brightwellii TaxID=49249 RepID=A0A7S4RUA3_9STRA
MYVTVCCLESKFQAGNWPQTKTQLKQEIKNILDKSKLHETKMAKKQHPSKEGMTAGWIIHNMMLSGLCVVEGKSLRWYHYKIHEMKRRLPKEIVKETTRAIATFFLSGQNKVLDSTKSGNSTPSLPQSGSSTPTLTTEQSSTWVIENTGMQIKYVQTKANLKKCLSSNEILNGTGEGLCAIDCEGVPDSLDLIQIATLPQQAGSLITIYVIDCTMIGIELVCNSILPLLQSNHIIKLIHDLHMDMVALSSAGLEGFNCILDTQLAAEDFTGNPFVGMNALLKMFGAPEHPLKNKMQQIMKSNTNVWSKRPLLKSYIEYAGM